MQESTFAREVTPRHALSSTGLLGCHGPRNVFLTEDRTLAFVHAHHKDSWQRAPFSKPDQEIDRILGSRPPNDSRLTLHSMSTMARNLSSSLGYLECDGNEPLGLADSSIIRTRHVWTAGGFRSHGKGRDTA